MALPIKLRTSPVNMEIVEHTDGIGEPRPGSNLFRHPQTSYSSRVTTPRPSTPRPPSGRSRPSSGLSRSRPSSAAGATSSHRPMSGRESRAIGEI